MDTLGLGTAPAVAPPDPSSLQHEFRKSPLKAWLLSFVVPGAGQFYCDRRARGAWTLVFSAVSLACVMLLDPLKANEEMFWGMALRLGIVLWVFASLDAFYTAQEINAGVDQIVESSNPRVAAVLNLTTKGFGYFYLGDRGKGLTVFLALTVVNSFARREPESVLRGIGVELLLLAIAADAYRLGRAEVRKLMPAGMPWPVASPSRLSAALPISFAVLAAFNYALLIAFGSLAPSYSPYDQSQASITQAENQPAVYSNLVYGVSVTAPVGWNLSNTDKEALLVADKYDGGCNVQLTADTALPFIPLAAFAQDVTAEIAAMPGYAFEGESPAEFAGRNGVELRFRKTETLEPEEGETEDEAGEYTISQKLYLARSWHSVYMATSTELLGLGDECGAEMESIRKSVRFD